MFVTDSSFAIKSLIDIFTKSNLIHDFRAWRYIRTSHTNTIKLLMNLHGKLKSIDHFSGISLGTCKRKVDFYINRYNSYETMSICVSILV